MPYRIEYYNSRVLSAIERWPVGVLADYARLVELLGEFGPELRMPHSRSMGGGLFELRARGREGSGRAFFCFASGDRVVVLHACMKKTRTTQPRDLAIARARRNEIRDAGF